MQKELILASASPRRRDLLTQIGCRFSVIPSDAAEDNDRPLAPEALTIQHAAAKAGDIAARYCGPQLVLGADTVVALDGVIFGKPADKADAARMLTALSGQTHEVVTGVVLIDCQNGTTWQEAVKTRVTFHRMTNEEIEAYIASGEPMDKAGAYAIQGRGAVFVKQIEGCYANVVGLPVSTVYKILQKAGVTLL